MMGQGAQTSKNQPVMSFKSPEHQQPAAPQQNWREKQKGFFGSVVESQPAESKL
jgi:hypothetical protein